MRLDQRQIEGLFRRVESPPPLSDIQLRRIARRLDDPAAPPRRGARWALTLGALAVCIGAALLWSARRAPEHYITVAEGERVTARDRVHTMVLIGPGALAYDRLDRPRLERGRLLVRAGAASMTVQLPHGQIDVPAGALIDTEVHASHFTVATCIGSVRVVSFETRAAIELPQGQAATCKDGCSVPEPVGASEIIDVEQLLREIDHPSEPLPRAAPAAEASDRLTPPAPIPVPQQSVPAKRMVVASRRPAPLTSMESGPAVGNAPAVEHHKPQRLASESALLEDALHQLRDAHAPALALAATREYRARFPDGALGAEADRIDLEAMLALQRSGDALARLERIKPATRELKVLRGELRVAAGRCEDALADFAVVIDGSGDSIDERASYARSSCALPSERAAELRLYLERFPSGAHANEVRRALQR